MPVVCCPPYTQSFSNVPVTTISYNQAMVDQYGKAPMVEVFYYDDMYHEYVKNPYPSLTISSGLITVDHGGPATGYIKIS